MDIDENAPGNRSQQGVTRTTDNETGHDPRREAPEVPLPPDDEAAVEEDMTDVEAGNSVLSEHPEAGNTVATTTRMRARHCTSRAMRERRRATCLRAILSPVPEPSPGQ